jgi:hypothetical protein
MTGKCRTSAGGKWASIAAWSRKTKLIFHHSGQTTKL